MTTVADDPRRIVMHPALVPAFEEWLASRGLECRQIPGFDEPDEVWIITPTDAAMGLEDQPADRTRPGAPWTARVHAVVDEAHAENWGGDHRAGFCKACADAYIVAQHAVPGGPGT